MNTTPEGAQETTRQAAHTPEPWWVNTINEQIGDIWAVNPNVPIAQAQMIGSLRNPNHVQRQANAERIVACINACAGINNPAAIKDLIQYARELIAAHDDDQGEPDHGQFTVLKGALVSLDQPVHEVEETPTL